MNDYVKNIIISNFQSDSLACYLIESKVIYINYQKLICAIGIDCSRRLIDSTYYQKLLYLNCYILRILLHEIEHIKQEKKILINNGTLETKILIESSQLERKLKQNKLYDNKMYFLNPLERQAELRSCRTILNIAEILSDNLLCSLIDKEYNELCIMDYEFVNSKCIFPYVKFIGETVNSFVNKKHLLQIFNTNERFDLGLEISEKEYIRTREKI